MCSEVTVSRYVAKRRIELSLNHIEVAVPQTHEPGAEAEVDFGEFWTRIGGMPVKCWMFVMRLSCSGRAFHVAFSTQGQEAFLQGHVLAFKDLLLLDEVGYVQIDPRGAELLFQVITEREERASIGLASNLPFSEWGTVFPDPRLVAAIVDRITFNAHILETGTNSYRLRTSKTAVRRKLQGRH